MKKLLTMLLTMSIVPVTFGGVVYIEESSDADGNGDIHFQAELEEASRLYLSSSVIDGAADLATARGDAAALLDTVEIAGDTTIELGKYSQAKSTNPAVATCLEMESTDGMAGWSTIDAITVSDDANFANNASQAACSTADEGTGQRMTFVVPVGFVMENSGNDAKILLENTSADTVAGDGVAATFENVSVISNSNTGAVQSLMPADGQISLIKDLADDLFQYGDAGEMQFSLELDLEPGAVKAASVASDIRITVEAQ